MASIDASSPPTTTPSLTRKLTKNKLLRPRFSILFGTILNTPQLTRQDSSDSTNSYTTASEATTASTSVLEPTSSAATSPTVEPASTAATSPTVEPISTAATSPTVEATAPLPDAEICPTCKARTLSSDSVPRLSTTGNNSSNTMTPEATSPHPQPEPTNNPLSSNPPRLSSSADQDQITPIPLPSPGLPAPETAAAAAAATTTSINYKSDKKHQRPKLQRNLSSLWKLLDPPELRSKTGVLHDLAALETKAEREIRLSKQGGGAGSGGKGSYGHRRDKSSVDEITLNETMGYGRVGRLN